MKSGFNPLVSGYKPNYFQFIGADDIDNEEGDITCDGKFQISFATPLRNPTRLASDLFTRVVNFTGPLYFSYTQRAFWELCKESLPFSETNYMPEFFWAKNVEVFGRDAVHIGIFQTSHCTTILNIFPYLFVHARFTSFTG